MALTFSVCCFTDMARFRYKFSATLKISLFFLEITWVSLVAHLHEVSLIGPQLQGVRVLCKSDALHPISSQRQRMCWLQGLSLRRLLFALASVFCWVCMLPFCVVLVYGACLSPLLRGNSVVWPLCGLVLCSLSITLSLSPSLSISYHYCAVLIIYAVCSLLWF